LLTFFILVPALGYDMAEFGRTIDGVKALSDVETGIYDSEVAW
jgi:hypothetical protein